MLGSEEKHAATWAARVACSFAIVALAKHVCCHAAQPRAACTVSGPLGLLAAASSRVCDLCLRSQTRQQAHVGRSHHGASDASGGYVVGSCASPWGGRPALGEVRLMGGAARCTLGGPGCERGGAICKPPSADPADRSPPSCSEAALRSFPKVPVLPCTHQHGWSTLQDTAAPLGRLVHTPGKVGRRGNGVEGCGRAECPVVEWGGARASEPSRVAPAAP